MITYTQKKPRKLNKETQDKRNNSKSIPIQPLSLTTPKTDVSEVKKRKRVLKDVTTNNKKMSLNVEAGESSAISSSEQSGRSKKRRGERKHIGREKESVSSNSNGESSTSSFETMFDRVNDMLLSFSTRRSKRELSPSSFGNRGGCRSLRKKERRVRSKGLKPQSDSSVIQVLDPSSRSNASTRRRISFRGTEQDYTALLTIEPLEITLIVFDLLSIKNLLTCAQVCKAWGKALKGYDRYSQNRGPFVFRWEIFSNLQTRERQFSVGRYLYNQPAITPHMRAVLVDWLVQVNNEFENQLETFFLAIKMVDKFLNNGPQVPRAEVQLVGVACLLLASKLEETHYPDLIELLYLCDGIYTREQLLDMEAIILRQLDHTLHMPTVLTFLKHILVDFPLPPAAHSLCLYLAEQGLLDYDLASVPPSLLASTIYSYVAFHFGYGFQNALEMTNYTEADMFACAVSLYACQRGAATNPLQHIRNKHATPAHHNASSVIMTDTFLTKLVK